MGQDDPDTVFLGLALFRAALDDPEGGKKMTGVRIEALSSCPRRRSCLGQVTPCDRASGQGLVQLTGRYTRVHKASAHQV